MNRIDSYRCSEGRGGPAAYRECSGGFCREYTFGWSVESQKLAYRETAVIDCRPAAQVEIDKSSHGFILGAFVLALCAQALHRRLYTPDSPLHDHLENQITEFEKRRDNETH